MLTLDYKLQGEDKASTAQTIPYEFLQINKTLPLSIISELNYNVLNYKY